MVVAIWVIVVLLVLILTCLVKIVLTLNALYERVHNWFYYFPSESIKSLSKLHDIYDVLRDNTK